MYFLAKILKALHSAADPWQLAAGFMFGMIMGLTPLWSLHNLLVIFIVLFFRINLTTFLLSLSAFSVLGLLIAPLMMGVGESLLNAGSMQSLWSALYNTSLGRLSQFNNTLTMGSLVIALLLAPPVLIVSKLLVVRYRAQFMQWVEQLRVVQFVRGTRAFQLYQSWGN